MKNYLKMKSYQDQCDEDEDERNSNDRLIN